MEKFVVLSDKSKIEAAAQTGKLIVWDGREELHELLEKMDLEEFAVDPKICKEIRFKRPVTVRIERGEKFEEKKAKTLSEILKMGCCDEDCTIIVESNDLSETFDLIQQFINLGLNPDVYTRKDFLKKSIVKKFDELYPVLKKKIEEVQEDVEKFLPEVQNNLRRGSFGRLAGQIKEDYESMVKEIQETSEDVKRSLKEAGEELIKVSVFATKKAGKSMVVNAFLGEEYAPTSQELPTPNVIVYKPSEDEKIKLSYRGATREFKSALELKDFIKQEFEAVKRAGKKLPEMVVFYPPKTMEKYELYDTPGPDLAGSEHAEVVKEYIDKADVSVFVVDYTKHAQESEINLFKQVRRVAKERGRAYSFVCAVNKIDQMYKDSDTRKIVVRVSDFIRAKLKELGFENFVVIPTTALVHFYLMKLVELFPELSKSENLLEDLEKLRMKLKKEADKYPKYIRKTYLPNVKAMVEYAVDVHDVESISFDEFSKLINFETLEKYVLYIVKGKAKLEKIYDSIKNVSIYVTKIRNLLGAEKAKQRMVAKVLSEKEKNKRKELERKLNSIENAIERFFEEVNREGIDKSFEEFFTKVEDTIEDFLFEKMPERVKEYAKKSVGLALEEKLDNLIRKLYDDVELLKKRKFGRDEFERKYKSINFSISEEELRSVLKSALRQVIKNMTLEWLENEKRRYESMAERIRIDVVRALDELKRQIKKEFALSLEVDVPRFKLDFSIERIRKILEDEASKLNFSASVRLESSVFSNNIKGGFWKWLGFGDRYEVNTKKIADKIREKFADVEEQILKEIDKLFSQTETHRFFSSIRGTLKDIKKMLRALKSQTFDYIDSVYKPIEKLRRDLREHLRQEENLAREKIEMIRRENAKSLKLLEELHNKLISVWDNFDKQWKPLESEYQKIEKTS